MFLIHVRSSKPSYSLNKILYDVFLLDYPMYSGRFEERNYLSWR